MSSRLVMQFTDEQERLVAEQAALAEARGGVVQSVRVGLADLGRVFSRPHRRVTV